MSNTEAVRVIVRSRPLSKTEKDRGNYSIVQFDRSINQVAITDTKSLIPKTFAYDAVFDDSFTQQQLYDESAYPLVESTLKGYNSTIFAYGQTGCGKTYTMLGIPTDSNLRGIIPNSFAHIFGCISESKTDKMFLVRCSYIEIYNEEIRDLLKYDPNSKLELKESKDRGIFVKNLSTQTVTSIADIGTAMDNGNSHRTVKATNMNEKSSRSHAIFTIYIETSEKHGDKNLIKAGKLNLVDLAGSERQKKTGAEGDRLKEAIKINLSLSALGNVINSLVEGGGHIPYRDSKLTMLLQDSLGGNTKTLMIAVISPADYNYDESLSTLRYASRAKFIQNKPKVNEDPKDALLREYAEEIDKLKKLLEHQSRGEPVIVEKVVEKYVEVPVKKKRAQVEAEVEVEELDEPVKRVSQRFTRKLSKLENSAEEYEQKKQLDKMMEEIKNQLIQGGETLNKAEQERLNAQKEYRKKLRSQKNKEKKLIEEFKKREEEVELKEKQYANMQEELEDLRKVSKQLKVKCKAANAELNDVNHEFELEKEEILENCRAKQVENEFLLTVAKRIVPNQDVRKIKEKSKFDEINKVWKFPNFVIQEKNVFFTKIAGNQVREAMQDKVVRFKDAIGHRKPSQKNVAKGYFSDHVEERIRVINDNNPPVPNAGAVKNFQNGKSSLGFTEKPPKQKVFLQPLDARKRY